MSERATASSRTPVTEPIGFTIVLAILAWAQGAPTFLIAIATIAFGAALLLHGSADFAEYGRPCAGVGAAAAPAVIPIQGGGLSAVLRAGAGGIVLGILAVLGISTIELTAITVIAHKKNDLRRSSVRDVRALSLRRP
jgi:hypothetical protein